METKSLRYYLENLLGIKISSVINLKDIKLAKELKNLVSFIAGVTTNDSSEEDYYRALQEYRKNKLKRKMKGLEPWS